MQSCQHILLGTFGIVPGCRIRRNSSNKLEDLVGHVGSYYMRAPRSCPTILPHDPAPRSCPTILPHDPAPRSCPTILAQRALICYCYFVCTCMWEGVGVGEGWYSDPMAGVWTYSVTSNTVFDAGSNCWNGTNVPIMVSLSPNRQVPPQGAALSLWGHSSVAIRLLYCSALSCLVLVGTFFCSYPTAVLPCLELPCPCGDLSDCCTALP